MVSDFFNIAEHRMNKHLTQWMKRHLPFVLGGDALPAAYIASWLLGEPIPAWIPNTYFSETHNTVITVRDCGSFLVKDQNPKAHRLKHFYSYAEELQEMAPGTGCLWDPSCVSMFPFQKFVEDNWIKIATNSQLAERWVKDSNECTATSKDEKMANIYAIIRSRTVISFNDDSTREHKDCMRKASKFFTQGKLGERIDKRTGALEVMNKKKETRYADQC